MAEFQSAKVTQPAAAMTQFGRPASGLSVVGVLTPTDPSSYGTQIRIERDELVIGRGSRLDGIDLPLADENASRRHARIRRVDDHFVIEDLGSSNGTFVDGIPVRWALIHDGDKIRVGRSVFYFDQVFEFGEESEHETLQESSSRRPIPGNKTRSDKDAMSVRFWGTRGSLPTPGSATSKYGGNTTCVEVRFGDAIIVLDAGSGIREMSRSWLDEFSGDPVHASLLLTHLHWDHIQGFPFFAAAYQPGNKIDIYGAHREAGSTEELLGGQMQGAYFPIPLSAMQAKLEYIRTTPDFSIGDVEIQTFGLPHPGGCLGYRFTAGGSVFVFATDCELDQIALNRNELTDNRSAPRQYDPAVTKWMEAADLLVVDCQYTDEEYRGKIGWGHNSIKTVVDLCGQVRPKKLGLIHHDPMSTDAMVTQRVHHTAQLLADRGVEDTLVFGAREQLCLNVTSSGLGLKSSSSQTGV